MNGFSVGRCSMPDCSMTLVRPGGAGHPICWLHWLALGLPIVEPRPCGTCGKPSDHAEHDHDRVRAWCEQHTPWSGHFEFCGEPCRELRGGR